MGNIHRKKGSEIIMKLFSTEQISKYHPDKYADQISDAIVTECLRQDKNSRVAVETMVKNDIVVIAGEITTEAKVNYEEVVRKVANKLNYKVSGVINLISKQSPQINKAVTKDKELGAGDNGLMFGYATNETDTYLPYAFDYANKVIKALEKEVKYGVLNGDAKTQVTVDLETNEIKTVVINAAHHEQYDPNKIQGHIEAILKENNLYIEGVKYLVNTGGIWTLGGPAADTGLTGRKIVADQYGGFTPVGGGAFSGKDPSKVDRTASYFARKIAVDLVKKFDLKDCEIQIGFAIGQTKPISLNIKADTDKDLKKYVEENYDLTVSGMIKHLDLLNKDFEKIAEGCHYRLSW